MSSLVCENSSSWYALTLLGFLLERLNTCMLSDFVFPSTKEPGSGAIPIFFWCWTLLPSNRKLQQLSIWGSQLKEKTLISIWNLNSSGFPVVLFEELSGTVISRAWEWKGHRVWKGLDKRCQEEKLAPTFCCTEGNSLQQKKSLMYFQIARQQEENSSKHTEMKYTRRQ